MTTIQRRQLVALTALVTVTAPAPASAHAILAQSTPHHAGRLGAGVQTLTLRFNSRLDLARSRLTLLRPDKSAEVLALLPGSDDVLSASVALAPGAHVVRWQVLALDGHITRGEVPFTVTAP